MTLTPSDIALLREFPASAEAPQGLTPEQRRRVEDLPWGLLRNGRRTDLGDDVVEMADRVAALEDQERARRILADRDASLSADEYEQRAADDAALLASPKAGGILGALEREALYERHLRWRTLAQVERLRHERDAYRKAKQENDERFMIERDEARAALRRATEPMPDDLLGVRLVNGCASLPDDTPAWVALLLREAWTAIRVLRADGVTKAARLASLDEEVERLEAEAADMQRAHAETLDYLLEQRDVLTKERDAARSALSGEATTSPSALAPQGSQTPQ